MYSWQFLVFILLPLLYILVVLQQVFFKMKKLQSSVLEEFKLQNQKNTTFERNLKILENKLKNWLKSND